MSNNLLIDNNNAYKFNEFLFLLYKTDKTIEFLKKIILKNFESLFKLIDLTIIIFSNINANPQVLLTPPHRIHGFVFFHKRRNIKNEKK